MLKGEKLPWPILHQGWGSRRSAGGVALCYLSKKSPKIQMERVVVLLSQPEPLQSLSGFLLD